eukprot:5334102-Amphidinium_carterae.1
MLALLAISFWLSCVGGYCNPDVKDSQILAYWSFYVVGFYVPLSALKELDNRRVKVLAAALSMAILGCHLRLGYDSFTSDHNSAQ